MRSLKETDIAELKSQLDNLATAKGYPIVYVKQAEDGSNLPVKAEDYQAVVNEKTGKVETVASKGYVIIQHKQAFGAVLDAMVAASNGATFKSSVIEQNGRAYMTVVFSDMVADDGASGIQLGIKVTNSYDKTTALKYSGTNKENHEGRFEFFGLRLACQNGMTVKVSIEDFANLNVVNKAEAKVGDFVGVVKEESKQSVYEAKSYIRHYGKNTEQNVEQVRNMILALPSVAKRLEAQIKATKSVSMTAEEAAKRLESLGFGTRMSKKVMEQFAAEEKTAWNLYNCVTSYASHTEKVSPRNMENILQKAQAIMEVSA
jgi:hypothetical protein